MRHVFPLVISLLLSSLLVFQNCGKTPDGANVAQEAAKVEPLKCLDEDCSTVDITPVDKSCYLSGQVIADGKMIIAYEKDIAETCVSQVRTCENANLSGDYTYLTCKKPTIGVTYDNCMFSGKTVEHKSSVKAYLKGVVDDIAKCVGENRSCDDGVLSGSYNFESCQLGPKSCKFNGTTLKHSEFIKAFNLSVNGKCDEEIRTCVDGRLTGQYKYSTCIHNEKSCSFNDVVIAHGGSVSAYQFSSSFDACLPEKRICSNGVLSGSFAFASCVINKPKSCIFNGQTLNHSESALAFEKSTVPFDQVCLQQKRTCNDGVLSGKYLFASCVKDSPLACLVFGKTVPSGDSVVSYGKALGSASEKCIDLALKHKCANGVFETKPMFESCVDAVTFKNCKINDKNILHGDSIELWSKQNGVCSSLKRECKDGLLSGDAQYSSPSCTATPVPSTCPAGQKLENNICVAVTCPSGQALINDVCKPVPICAANEHLEKNICVSNLRSCIIANGGGRQSWDGSKWGQCSAAYCSSGFSKFENSCLPVPSCFSDKSITDKSLCEVQSRVCAVENGMGEHYYGTTSYSINWTPCEARTCSKGYVLDRGKCVEQLSSKDKALFKKLILTDSGGCGLGLKGNLLCWGEFDYSYDQRFKTVLITEKFNFNGAQDLAVNDTSGCVVDSNNKLQCWGWLERYGGKYSISPLTEMTLAGNVKRVHLGLQFLCTVGMDDLVRCAGYNASGQLGVGTTTASKSLQLVKGLGPVADLSLGGSHACALQKTGEVMCWGNGASNGQSKDVTSPITIKGVGVVKNIYAGGGHSCVITAGDELKCWGYNGGGSIGNGSTKVGTVGVTTILKNVKSYSSHIPSCAVTKDNRVHCWGRSLDYLMQQNISGVVYPAPVLMSIPAITSNINSIVVRDSRACVLLSTNEVQCWGSNNRMGLGNSYPKLLAFDARKGSHLSQFKKVESTKERLVNGPHGHACGLTNDNVFKCWGSNYNGELGMSTEVRSATAENPVVPSIPSSISKFGLGLSQTCVLNSLGDVYCFGNRTYTGGVAYKGVQKIALPVKAKSISVGRSHACALTTVDTVYCWGLNNYGQLGNNTTVTSTVPSKVDVPLSKSVHAGGNYSCAVTQANRPYCWGDSTFQLRFSQLPKQEMLSPVMLAGYQNVKDISINLNSVCMHFENKSLSCRYGDPQNLQKDVTVGNVKRIVTTAVSEGRCLQTVDGGWRCDQHVSLENSVFRMSARGFYLDIPELDSVEDIIIDVADLYYKEKITGKYGILGGFDKSYLVPRYLLMD